MAAGSTMSDLAGASSQQSPKWPAALCSVIFERLDERMRGLTFRGGYDTHRVPGPDDVREASAVLAEEPLYEGRNLPTVPFACRRIAAVLVAVQALAHLRGLCVQ